jgi:hypothetical protein
VKGSEQQFIYNMLRTSLDDARANVMVAEKNAAMKRWRNAAVNCSIAARILRDLRTDLELEDALLVRQVNFINGGIDDVYRMIWRLMHQLRHHAGHSKEIVEVGRALTRWGGITTGAKAVEA